MPRQNCTDSRPKKRQGGSPQISATCYTIGSIETGTDGQSYEVRPWGKTQRWVKLTAAPPVAKAGAPKRTASPPPAVVCRGGVCRRVPKATPAVSMVYIDGAGGIRDDPDGPLTYGFIPLDEEVPPEGWYPKDKYVRNAVGPRVVDVNRILPPPPKPRTPEPSARPLKSSPKRACPPDMEISAFTGRCVKKCPPHQIRNPETGRCVNRNSPKGLELMAGR